jgi:hypothetical protein
MVLPIGSIRARIGLTVRKDLAEGFKVSQLVRFSSFDNRSKDSTLLARGATTATDVGDGISIRVVSLLFMLALMVTSSRKRILAFALDRKDRLICLDGVKVPRLCQIRIEEIDSVLVTNAMVMSLPSKSSANS